MTKICDSCPMRLYNSKHHNLHGIGNPWSDNVIILPNVDYDAYKVGDLNFSKQAAIISEILSTGVLEETFYILPLIRCNEVISCKVNEDIIKLCSKYLIEDIKVYNWHNFLVCGTAWERLFGRNIKSDLENAIYSVKYNRLYVPNYNPLVKYTDDAKFEIFKNHLLKWYNAITNKHLDYELLYL